MESKAILKGKKILIVDDEPDILETLEELLDMCSVDSAPDFETAAKFLRTTPYDAAIFDIMGVDGYQLLEKARRIGLPALMLTAHALDPDHLTKSIRSGAQAYLPKDKMAEIELYLADVLTAAREGVAKSGNWFMRLKPFFEKKFGKEWRKPHQAFWEDFERTCTVTREELRQVL